MAALICGVGYIGSLLAAHLLTSGETVVGFDNGFSTDPRALEQLRRHDRFTLVEGDVASAADVSTAFAPGPFETVYMLAAQASADETVATAEYTEATNLRGPRLVFEECRRSDVQTIVLGSSMRVYGQPLPAVVDESTAYGQQRDLSHLSKIYAEKLLEMYAGRWSVRAVAARLAIVYGLSPVMKQTPAFMTVPNRFSWLAVRQEPLRVHPGAGPLALLHVEDAVRALIQCAHLGGTGFRAANVVGEWATLPQLAELVAAEAGRRDIPVEIIADPEQHATTPVVSSALDSTGFRPARNLRSAVRELLDHWLVARG